MKSLFHLSLFVALAFSQAAEAEERATINDLNDVFAGSFQCSLGIMGMSLQLHDTGPLPRDCDPNCAEASLAHGIEGIVHFFPTVANPQAPEGAFTASGTVNYSYVGDKATASIEMEPSAWLDEPENFGASGLRLSIFFEGDTALMMSGTPTAEGCHGMMLSAVPNQ